MTDNYNTQASPILLKEYGRNIQKMAQYIVALEDKEQQKRMAISMIQLMKQINPGLKDNQEYEQKIWSDLFHICEFKLDVVHPELAVPIQIPPDSRPKRVPYSDGRIKLKHFGKNLENLIREASKLTDAEKIEEASIYLARTLKRFYQSWNKEVVDDEVIVKNLEMLSGGVLTLSLEKIKEESILSVFPVKDLKQSKARATSTSSSYSNSRGSNSSNFRSNSTNRSNGGSTQRRTKR